MDDPEAQLRLQPYLLAGERILWTGQPDPRRLVGGKDAYLIPFSLMWGGGAVFWEAAVLLSGAPIFFVLWGIPFVLVGQYLIWGRLLAKRWDKKRTVYAVTSQRVLVVRGRSLQSAYLTQLPSIDQSTRADGSGTLEFGPGVPFGYRVWANTGMDVFGGHGSRRACVLRRSRRRPGLPAHQPGPHRCRLGRSPYDRHCGIGSEQPCGPAVTMLSWAEVAVGLVIILATFFDLFRSVVLPRPSINRFILVRLLFITFWGMWRWVGRRIQLPARRETWLATFGPSAVIAMFLTWALAFMLGYALLLDGMRTQVRPSLDGFWESLYFSATTIVPLSYGDFVPTGLGTRLTIIFESATGVGIAALVITLLFSLYASFQAREELVVQLDAVAGAPPSGVQLLETVAERGLRDELVKTFDDWRAWSAAVLESHLAYPILLYFRSSHDNEAWLNSFGAVMDAASLM